MYDLLMEQQAPALDTKAIRDLLDKFGWKDTELSKKSGVSKSMLSMMLNGERPNASAVVVARIAQALGVKIETLLGISEAVVPAISPQGAAAAKIIDRLSPDYQARGMAALREIERRFRVSQEIGARIEGLLIRVEELGGAEFKADLARELHALALLADSGNLSPGAFEALARFLNDSEDEQ